MAIVSKCPSMSYELPPPVFTADGIRVEAVSSFGKLFSFSRDWNALAREQGVNPTLSGAWLISHLEERLNPGESWFCLLAFDGDQLVGVMPIVTVPRRFPFGRKCLRFETPYDIFTTTAVEPLVRRGYEERVCPAFQDYLWEIPCDCCCLKLRGLCSERFEHAKDRTVFRRSTCLGEEGGRECFLPVEGSAEDYFGSLSKNFSRNLRRIGRRIEEQPGSGFRLESGNAKENTEQFMALEHRNWKSRRGTSIYSDASYVKFFRRLSQRLEEEGWLRWAFMDLAGKPVAGQFMVQNGRTLYVVKIGYDESFSKFSPGTALFGNVIRQAFDFGEVDEINFMSGYSWMKDWNVSERKLVHATVFPDTPRRWGLCKQPMQLQSALKRFVP